MTKDYYKEKAIEYVMAFCGHIAIMLGLFITIALSVLFFGLITKIPEMIR